jgi:hypothetical protein
MWQGVKAPRCAPLRGRYVAGTTALGGCFCRRREYRHTSKNSADAPSRGLDWCAYEFAIIRGWKAFPPGRLR